MRAPRYWHGGAPGLVPGDMITPRRPDDTRHLHALGECATCDARRAGGPLAFDDNDPTMVYITTARDYARLYASGYPRGSLYVVEPVGEMVDRWREGTGEDCEPSWGVPAARVLLVYDRLVSLTPKEVGRLERRWKLNPEHVRATKYGVRR